MKKSLAAALAVLGLAGVSRAGELPGFETIPGCEDPSQAGFLAFQGFRTFDWTGKTCEKACKLGLKACKKVGSANLACGTKAIAQALKMVEVACNDPIFNEGDAEACFEAQESPIAQIKLLLATERLSVRTECASEYLDCLPDCED